MATQETVGNWSEVPAQRDSLTLSGDLGRMFSDTRVRMVDLLETIYYNSDEFITFVIIPSISKTSIPPDARAMITGSS
jgi:hypothetical protein